MRKKIFKFLGLLIIVLIFFVIAARLAGYRAMKYPADSRGLSMYPTVSPGDIWLCRMKRGYASGELSPGTVVLFPKDGFKFLLTKRIIALENQTVAVNEQGTFVDGKKIEEPYAFTSGEKPSGINAPHATAAVEAVKVPPGKLFVMGDNRDNSFDSRDPKFGFVDAGDVVGKPVLILWARDKSRIGKSMR